MSFWRHALQNLHEVKKQCFFQYQLLQVDYTCYIYVTWSQHKKTCATSTEAQILILTSLHMGMRFFKFNNPLMSGV